MPSRASFDGAMGPLQQLIVTPEQLPTCYNLAALQLLDLQRLGRMLAGTSLTPIGLGTTRLGSCSAAFCRMFV